MVGSIMMGSMFYSGSYVGLFIIGIVAVILFVAGLLHRDNLIKWTDIAYNKLMNNQQ